MSSLEEVYEGDSRWRAAVTTALVFAASVVAAVGFVAAMASLIAGFGVRTVAALKLAVLLAGVALPLAFFALPTGANRGDRVTAGVGVTLAGTGLALFWTELPSGWYGDPAALPLVAVGAYALGLVVVLWSRTSNREPAEGGPVARTSTTRDVGSAANTRAVGADGGTEDDELRFFDQDDT